MELHTHKCDECGAIKQESNHWFKAIQWQDGHFEVVRAEKAAGAFCGTEAEFARKKDILDLCSEQCAQKAMSKAIGAGK